MPKPPSILKNPRLALAVVCALMALAVWPELGARANVRSTQLEGQSSVLAAANAYSVRSLREGLTGSISGDAVTEDITGDGVREVLLGTSNGLYALSAGDLLSYIPTSSAVTDIAMLDDITGDGGPDVVVAVGDTFFPNIRAYDVITGQTVWQYAPKQEVFIDNLMWTEQQTRTFDVETVELTGDGSPDVVATSGYFAYALDGPTGQPVWSFEARDNLWSVVEISDIDGDGVADLALGGQNGYMHVLSGRDGGLMWESRIAPRYAARDDRGEPWKGIDQSVWDMAPVRIGNAPKAVVTAEDGRVRLVDLETGSVDWQLPVIDHVAALLDRYYNQKSGRATSPGDFHFFNLRAFPVEDVTGDGVNEVLIAAFLGRGQAQGQEPRDAGVTLLNPVSGTKLWETSSLSMDQAGQIAFATIDGRPKALFPSASLSVVDLEDGTVETIKLPGERDRSGRDRFAVANLDAGEILVVSDVRDAVGLTVAGVVQWDYPRVEAVTVERGDFTGSGVQDIAVWSKTASRNGDEPRARVVYVVDGSDNEIAWTYAMPHAEFAETGGLRGVMPTPDLNGDGKRDIVGYAHEDMEMNDGRSGTGSEILAFSGADGSIIFRGAATSDTYYGVWEDLHANPDLLETMIRARFDNEFEPNFASEWDRQEQDQRQQFEQRIGGDWDQMENQMREELRQQIDRDWNDKEQQLRALYDEQLRDESDGLRAGGASDDQVASFESQRRNEFDELIEQKRGRSESASWQEWESQLPAERARAEDDWREGFEAQLLTGREDQEKGARENFEQDQLPRELEEWRQRLAGERRDHRIDKRLVSLDVLRDPQSNGGVSLIAASSKDVFLLDSKGKLLWTRSVEPWSYQDPFTGEPEPGKEFSLTVDHGTRYKIPGDLNGDGIDDLVAFGSREIVTALSVRQGGQLTFKRDHVITLEQGMDPRQGRLADDLDGDGVRDIAYPIHQEAQGPRGMFVSSGTGMNILELPEYDPSQQGFGNVTIDMGAADVNGDGLSDALLFQRWVENAEGSRLRAIDLRSGDALWDFTEYRETFLFDRYDGPIMPATSISDFTGDGIADIALVRNLTWQAGARVEVYDATTGILAKSVVLEEIDDRKHSDQRWHPGLLAREISDFTGDGNNELAVVTALGQSAERKESRLVVVDLYEALVLADFGAMGTELLDLGSAGEFGVVGMTGQMHILSVISDLEVHVCGADGGARSPLTVQWTGSAPASFNQVFIDGIEVARSNEDTAIVAAGSGEHAITVRSLDENGRGVYRSVSFTVEEGALPVVLAYVAMAALLFIALWVPLSRIVGRYARRRGQDG
ncbi:MAG: hypothetical protein CL694_09440 [Chloroflexi bacterium]|nr:hypothetical protein [Chloroflexota bacterium]